MRVWLALFSEPSTKIREFDAADDNAALEVYHQKVESLERNDAGGQGFDDVESLERVDVVEKVTKLR